MKGHLHVPLQRLIFVCSSSPIPLPLAILLQVVASSLLLQSRKAAKLVDCHVLQLGPQVQPHAGPLRFHRVVAFDAPQVPNISIG
eukprot:CAMPEP_0117667720 /NCGR_PEP_ID=MMETSP0804-20121206/11133_1 /TAXON_ID=1074897 /ORGANISM="Tetraselmis astigmatica, Strain CCMP880" /LENGTH=84 /DNA_ID=CAMNT_0005475497 /DNA_START=369 /DNA_END=623 /DNA_ORIENTATION=+